MFVAQVREHYYQGPSLHHSASVPVKCAATPDVLKKWWEGLTRDVVGYIIPDISAKTCKACGGPSPWDEIRWDCFSIYEVPEVLV